MSSDPNQQAPVSSTTMTRSALRPPGTLRKPPPPTPSGTAQNTRLNNYMVQNRFRLLNPAPAMSSGAITRTGTILRPLQRLQQQAEYLLTSHNATTVVASDSSKSNSELSNDSPVSSSTSATTVVRASASRIPPPSGLPGLVRPTPTQQIVESTSDKPQQGLPPVGAAKISLATMRNNQFGSSSQLKQSSSSGKPKLTMQRSSTHVLTGSQTRLSNALQQRPRTATTLIQPRSARTATVSSVTVRSRVGSVCARPGGSVTSSTKLGPSSVPLAGQDSMVNPPINPTSGSNEFVSRLIDLSSVENDVGEIRKLLEQLVTVLQAAHLEQDNKDRENERLKQEVRELKSKIRSIRSTVAATADSEPPTPNIPQHVFHHEYTRLGDDRSPRVTENDVCNSTIEKPCPDETLAIDDRERVASRDEPGDARPSNGQSVYLSPMN